MKGHATFIVYRPLFFSDNTSRVWLQWISRVISLVIAFEPMNHLSRGIVWVKGMFFHVIDEIKFAKDTFQLCVGGGRG